MDVDVHGSGMGGDTSKLVNAVAGGSMVIVIIAQRRDSFIVHATDEEDEVGVVNAAMEDVDVRIVE